MGLDCSCRWQAKLTHCHVTHEMVPLRRRRGAIEQKMNRVVRSTNNSSPYFFLSMTLERVTAKHEKSGTEARHNSQLRTHV